MPLAYSHKGFLVFFIHENQAHYILALDNVSLLFSDPIKSNEQKQYSQVSTIVEQLKLVFRKI